MPAGERITRRKEITGNKEIALSEAFLTFTTPTYNIERFRILSLIFNFYLWYYMMVYDIALCFRLYDILFMIF